MEATMGEWISSNIGLGVAMLVAFGVAIALIGYAFYRVLRARGERPLE
jgi:predicted cation transporter